MKPIAEIGESLGLDAVDLVPDGRYAAKVPLEAFPSQRPQGYPFPITAARISAGAGFVYALAGNIQTLAGLPFTPNALTMDVNADGSIAGLA